MTYGIDVSHWQGMIDWEDVAEAGWKYAIIKATEGTSFTDSKFHYNWAEAKGADMITGAYHYFRPGVDPKGQAEHFFNTVGSLSNGDIIPWLDVEDSKPSVNSSHTVAYQVVLEQALACLAECSKLFKCQVGIYTGLWFWDRLPIDSISVPLWVAYWYKDKKPKNPKLPRGWTDYNIHQYTSKGRIQGIDGFVDQNWSPKLKEVMYYKDEQEEPPPQQNYIQNLRERMHVIANEVTVVQNILKEL